MSTRPTLLALATMVGLVACVPGLPSAPPAPPLGADQFSEADALPAGLPRPAASAAPAGGVTPSPAAATPAPPGAIDTSPFTETLFQDVATPTKFVPQLNFSFAEVKPGSEPEVSIDVYQTKGELELKEMRALVEGASFRYDKLQVGTIVGEGRMEVGTPPKLTLPVEMRVTQTDQATYAVISVKASQLLLEIYLSDIRVKQVGGNLQIISVGNFARGNDHSGRHTTEASGRVVNTIRPGFVVLPPQAGFMRSRTLFYSEDDPANGQGALRVFRQTLGLGY